MNNFLDVISPNQENEIATNCKHNMTNQNIFDKCNNYTIDIKNNEYKTNKCFEIMFTDSNKKMNGKEDILNHENELEIIQDSKEQSKCCYIF